MTVAIKERPILFSGPMVRAILDGRKTETRRLIKGVPTDWADSYCLGVHRGVWGIHKSAEDNAEGDVWRGRSPYGGPGDRLWVRETFCIAPERHAPDDHVYMTYVADGRRDEIDGSEIYMNRLKLGKSYPSIHMPRWAARITLEIEDVWLERVQDITEEGAIAEGLRHQIGGGTGPGPGFKWHGAGYSGIKRTPMTYHAPDRYGKCCCLVGMDSPARCAFRELWDSIYANQSLGWAANPWVWAYKFRKVER